MAASNGAPASWSAVAERSGDTAFARARCEQTIDNFRPHESGVSRLLSGFPPHSKTSRNFSPSFQNRPQFYLNDSTGRLLAVDFSQQLLSDGTKFFGCVRA